jgi:hypothetical protein
MKQKKIDISENTLKNISREFEYSKRLTTFMKTENIHLKNRISEIVLNTKDELLLNELECFQSRSVNYDTTIFIAEIDIATLTNALKTTDDLLTGTSESILKETGKIRNSLFLISKDFFRLNIQFNKFLTEKF